MATINPLENALTATISSIVSSTPAPTPAKGANTDPVSELAISTDCNINRALVETPPKISEKEAQQIQELQRVKLALEKQINKLRNEMTQSSLDAASTLDASSEPAHSTSSPLSLEKLPIALQKIVGSDLDVPDLAHLCKQNRGFHTTHTPEMLERRRITQELLPHVFKANPVAVATFFTKPDAKPKMVLTKTCYREGYLNRKTNKFVFFRHWKRVSPLQAAALSLDNFLVLDLIHYVEKDETLRLQAAQQLQEVLSRTEVPTSAKTLSVSKDTETKLKVEEDQCRKTQVESNTEVEADLSFYQAPFKNLLEAYSAYCTQFDTLFDEHKLGKLNKLWEKVGECHKQLPTYGLQEFFDFKPFDPLPAFTTPPNRGECRYSDGEILDLNALGFGTCSGLSKAYSRRVKLDDWNGVGVNLASFDSAAIHHLCELRQAELKYIIECLLKPGVAVTLAPTASQIKNQKLKKFS